MDDAASNDSNADDTLNGWLVTPIATLVIFLGNEMVIAGITQRALVAIQEMPLYFAIIERIIPAGNDAAKQAISRLRTLAGSDAVFARQETKDGFNTILMHHAVATWAAIETAIEQTLINHIRKVPNSGDLIQKNAPSLKANRIRTTTIKEALNTIRAWEQALDLKTTMDRAAHMLKAFDISLTLEESVKRSLSELAELRNVLLHNGGRIDQRFVNKCPWKDAKVGSIVRINSEEMSIHFDTAQKFAVDLLGQLSKSPYFRVKSPD